MILPSNVYFLHKTIQSKTEWNSNCLRKKGVAQESGPCNGGGGCHDFWILNQGLGSIAGRALPCGCCVGVRLGLDVHSPAWHRAGRYCHCGRPQVEPWTWQVWVFIGGQVFVNETKTVCWRYFLGDIKKFLMVDEWKNANHQLSARACLCWLVLGVAGWWMPDSVLQRLWVEWGETNFAHLLWDTCKTRWRSGWKVSCRSTNKSPLHNIHHFADPKRAHLDEQFLQKVSWSMSVPLSRKNITLPAAEVVYSHGLWHFVDTRPLWPASHQQIGTVHYQSLGKNNGGCGCCGCWVWLMTVKLYTKNEQQQYPDLFSHLSNMFWSCWYISWILDWNFQIHSLVNHMSL